jgi:hypothetical protein
MTRYGEAEKANLSALRLANRVNRDLDNLVARSVIGAVKRVKPPWERNSVGRPCWEPKVVATCLVMIIPLNRTYEGIAAYMQANTAIAKRLQLARLPEHSVIARGMAKMPLAYIRALSRLITVQLRRRGLDAAVNNSGFSLRKAARGLTSE